MAKHQITINYEGNYGIVELDDQLHIITAEIKGAPEKAAETVKFLAEPREVAVLVGPTIRDVQKKTVTAKDDLESFRLALTRLWVNTGVLVEWSMPPGAMDEIE